MDHWQALAAAVGIAALLLALHSALRKRKDREHREEQRRLELVLQPRETVKQICPQSGGRCILTSQRVIFDIHGSIHAVTIRSIRQCQGYNAQGKRTASVAQMKTLTLKAKQEYTIENTGEAFQELAKPLIAKVKKQSDSKKKRDAAKATKQPGDEKQK